MSRARAGWTESAAWYEMARLTTTVSAQGSQSSSSAASASSPVTMRDGDAERAQVQRVDAGLGDRPAVDLDEDGARVVRMTYDSGRMTRARVVADEERHVEVAVGRRLDHRQRLLALDEPRAAIERLGRQVVHAAVAVIDRDVGRATVERALDRRVRLADHQRHGLRDSRSRRGASDWRG